MSLLGKLNPARLPAKLREKMEKAMIETKMLNYELIGKRLSSQAFKTYYLAIDKTLTGETDNNTIKQWAFAKKRFSKTIGEAGPELKLIQGWLPDFYQRLLNKNVLDSDKKFILSHYLPYVKEAEKQQLAIELRESKLIK